MKIAYLSPAFSIHTVRWVNEMTKRGYEVHLVTMHPPHTDNPIDNNVSIYMLPFSLPAGYFLNKWRLKKLLRQISPVLLHTHYASGYGTLSRLSGFHPTVLSVWGSDVFDFPRNSIINRKILEFNLRKADYICSTSHIMATETQKYTYKEILVTPFGVDCEKFKPMPELKPKNKIIIGTIKTLEEKYGIEHLIKAFAIIVKQHPNLPLELHIGGKGGLKGKLQKLCGDLNIENKTKFLGYISHNEVPRIFNTFSIFVSVSDSESFGVAVIEAEACGIPVVVSNIGGLPEVVKNNMTGFIVPPRNPEATAKAIEKLILDEHLRTKMGKAGQQFVLTSYEWSKCAKIMENLYRSAL